MKLISLALSTLIISATALLNSCFPEPAYGPTVRPQLPPNLNIPGNPAIRPNPGILNIPGITNNPSSGSQSLRPSQIVNIVNSHRARMGKRMMRNNGSLAAQASNHSRYLLNIYNTTGRKSVAHTGFQNRFNALRGSARVMQLAENIGVISGNRPNPAQRTLNLWVNSPGHNANLNKDWTLTGVGVARATDGTIFVTQLYGK